MTDNWKKVFTTHEVIQARLAKDVLKENKIESVIFNKQDSVYMTYGDQEVLVPNDKAENAVQVLSEAGFIA